MVNTSTSHTITALRQTFAGFGLLKQVVSDNGPQFRETMAYGTSVFRHTTPHPMAERFLQTFKQFMKASQNDGRTLQQRLADFLLSYRITPHITTNQNTLFIITWKRMCSTNKVIEKNTTINKQKHVHLKSDKQSGPGTSGLETNGNQERLFDNWGPHYLSR